MRPRASKCGVCGVELTPQNKFPDRSLCLVHGKNYYRDRAAQRRTTITPLQKETLERRALVQELAVRVRALEIELEKLKER